MEQVEQRVCFKRAVRLCVSLTYCQVCLKMETYCCYDIMAFFSFPDRHQGNTCDLLLSEAPPAGWAYKETGTFGAELELRSDWEPKCLLSDSTDHFN